VKYGAFGGGEKIWQFRPIFFTKIICMNQHWVIFLVCQVKQKFAIPSKKNPRIKDQFPSFICFILNYVVKVLTIEIDYLIQ